MPLQAPHPPRHYSLIHQPCHQASHHISSSRPDIVARTMYLEVAKAMFGLVFLLGDISLVVACSVLHFLRGEVQHGTLQGAFTLGIFFMAGFITNLFHLFRHEWKNLPQEISWKTAKCLLLLFLPCSYLLRWYVGRSRSPKSNRRRCLTSSLRLFYCSGTFMQAVLQSFVVVHLWWEEDIPGMHVNVTMVAAVFFSMHAIYGVSGYIWTQYYDEQHRNLPALDYFLILVALFLNMGGRVAAMAVVMGTQGWYWLTLAVVNLFLVNYAVYITQVPSSAAKGAQKVWLFIFMVPLGFLSAITVSERKILTFITTVAWLAYSVPQIYTYHNTLSEWLVWSIPAAAQIIALIIIMFRWSAFEATFERFGRLARKNQFIKVPTE